MWRFDRRAGRALARRSTTSATFEVDRLLSLVYYHVVPGAPSLAALVQAGSADTYLDQLYSGSEMLTFAADGSQV